MYHCQLYKELGVEKLEALCDEKGLQVFFIISFASFHFSHWSYFRLLKARGSKGEHSPPGPNGEFDISNKRRIGYSEVELIQQMIDGVDELIKMEEAL